MFALNKYIKIGIGLTILTIVISLPWTLALLSAATKDNSLHPLPFSIVGEIRYINKPNMWDSNGTKIVTININNNQSFPVELHIGKPDIAGSHSAENIRIQPNQNRTYEYGLYYHQGLEEILVSGYRWYGD